MAIPGQPEEMAADGDRVYPAAGAAGLQIIEASDSNVPILQDTLDTPGSCQDVRVASGYALVADASGGLLTVDPGPPAAIVNTLSLGSPCRLDVLTGFEQSLVRILDVSNPAAPVQVSLIYIYYFAFDLSVSGNSLFLSGSTAGDLVVYDISNPLNVDAYFGMNFEFPARRHVRSGSRIYVHSGYSGNEPRSLHVIENADSGTPPVEFSLPLPNATSLLVRGDRAYVTGRYPGKARFRIVDVSQNAQPIALGELTLGDIGLYRPIGLDARDNLAFMTGHSNGLYIINVTNASAPALIHQVDTPGQAGAVVLIGNYVYVADGPNGLAIVDISVPGSAFLAGQFAVPGDAIGLTQVGGLLYVMAGEAGIHVLDLVNPLVPLIVGSLDTGYAQDLFVDGSIGYLADGCIEGLQILDLAEPLNPTIYGSARTPGDAEKVTVSGPFAYVGDGTEGVAVIDVQDSAHPRFVGSHLGMGGRGLAPVGPFLYVCDDCNWQLAVLGRQCVTVGVPEIRPLPIGLPVSPAYPNPSRGPVTARFTVPDAGAFLASISDIHGARVRTLFEGVQPAGGGTVTWDGRDDRGFTVPAGVYFMIIATSDRTAAQRVVRLH